MRYVAIAIFGLALIAGPATVQAQNKSSTSNTHNFGSMTCPGAVPCADEATDMSVLGKLASTCLTRYFSIPDTSDFFQDANLDADNCIAPSNANTSGTYPKCCIIHTTDTQCNLHCDMVSGH
jgi:hypothetical protein